MRINPVFVVPFILLVALVAPSLAGKKGSKLKTISTYSDCKSLGASDKKRCNACLNSGKGHFNLDSKTKKWVCGKTSDFEGMPTVADNLRGDPWPTPPKTMPAQQKSYAKIPAGKFTIGTPAPTDGSFHRASEKGSEVTITRPFLMKTTEVTHSEYFFVMKKMPRRYKAGCDDCPVLYVSWMHAIEYMNELSKLEKLEACYVIKGETVTWKGLDCTGYRLPTDAEWEYAGRGGVAAPLYGAIDDIAWHQDNSGYKRQPVGGKKANAYGLFDMMGNAAEYTWDEFQENAFEKPQTDPVIGGLEMKDVNLPRTIRGSTFVSNPNYQTIAARSSTGTSATSEVDTMSFRPVRTIKK